MSHLHVALKQHVCLHTGVAARTCESAVTHANVSIRCVEGMCQDMTPSMLVKQLNNKERLDHLFPPRVFAIFSQRRLENADIAVLGLADD